MWVGRDEIGCIGVKRGYNGCLWIGDRMCKGWKELYGFILPLELSSVKQFYEILFVKNRIGFLSILLSGFVCIKHMYIVHMNIVCKGIEFVSIKLIGCWQDIC